MTDKNTQRQIEQSMLRLNNTARRRFDRGTAYVPPVSASTSVVSQTKVHPVVNGQAGFASSAVNGENLSLNVFLTAGERISIFISKSGDQANFYFRNTSGGQVAAQAMASGIWSGTPVKDYTVPLTGTYTINTQPQNGGQNSIATYVTRVSEPGTIALNTRFDITATRYAGYHQINIPNVNAGSDYGFCYYKRSGNTMVVYRKHGNTTPFSGPVSGVTVDLVKQHDGSLPQRILLDQDDNATAEYSFWWCTPFSGSSCSFAMPGQYIKIPINLSIGQKVRIDVQKGFSCGTTWTTFRPNGTRFSNPAGGTAAQTNFTSTSNSAATEAGLHYVCVWPAWTNDTNGIGSLTVSASAV